MQNTHVMADPNELLFLRVVEAGSLKAAAEQIGSDPSVVSRRIAALESRLGVRLLQRSTKRSTPTEAGERYYAGLRRLVDEQAVLESEVTGLVDTPTGRLRIAAPVDFGARFVAPVVADLQNRFPDLAVDLVLGSGFAEMAESGIDVAVRIGERRDTSLMARHIGAVPRIIVASSAFLAKHGAPDTVDDLATFPFVFYGAGRSLELTLKSPERDERVTVRGATTANSVTAVRTLVERGCGLHLGPVWAFESGLADGSLAHVLPNHRIDAFPLNALYTPSDFVPAKTGLFIDALDTAMKAETAIETA